MLFLVFIIIKQLNAISNGEPFSILVHWQLVDEAGYLPYMSQQSILNALPPAEGELNLKIRAVVSSRNIKNIALPAKGELNTKFKVVMLWYANAKRLRVNGQALLGIINLATLICGEPFLVQYAMIIIMSSCQLLVEPVHFFIIFSTRIIVTF